MKVTLKARNMPLTESLRTAVEQEITKSVCELVGFLDARIGIELKLNNSASQKKNNECRVVLTIPPYPTIIIIETNQNMYQAIKLAKERLVEKIKLEKRRHAAAQPTA